MTSVQHYILTLLTILLLSTGSISAFTLVIDPGHGGHDHGAIEHKVSEKSVNLAVALEFGRQVSEKFPDVKIVYTRDADYYKTLQQRADIANAAHGDLFVSIHANSIDRRNRNRKTIQGASTYTLGLHRSDENLEVAKRENSVMKLEDDYATTYQGFDPESAESYIIFEMSQGLHLDQSIDFAQKVQSQMAKTAGRVDKGVRQAGFLVLAKTGMPAVLVELDYLCNPTQAAFMSSAKGQRKLAQALTNAFSAYYQPDSNTEAEPDHPADTATPEPTPSAAQTTAPAPTLYSIQFLTSDTRLQPGDKRLKGLTGVDAYSDGGVWKHTVGRHTTAAQARRHLKEVRKKFKDAFIITTCDGRRTGILK